MRQPIISLPEDAMEAQRGKETHLARKLLFPAAAPENLFEM